MPDQNNIQRDIEDLQERRELASRKLHDVEMQRIAETRAEEKIRLKGIIQGTEADLAAIDLKIERLTQGLQGNQATLASLFSVPNLPPRYLERTEYLDPFREALLSGEAEAVGITGRSQYVGVQGMGGLGKSVLAAALAWDEQVRRAFPDGIFWLRFGQEVDEAGVLELQKEILLVLAPDNLPESPAQGRNLLNLALQGKRCLLIADDLWESRHINHFDLADSGSRFLLTTRNNEVIQETGAHRCELELLSDKQARELLAKCSGFAEEDLPEEAEAILRECGRLPLAVAAIGSMVNGKGRSRWQLALDKLQNARLDKIPAKFDRYYGYENLFKVFQVSVEDLPAEVQEYFKTLIVFPEDAEIPESVLQLYWEHIAQGEYEPLEAVDMLVQRSLLTPAGEESFTLHDLLRDYLVFQADGEVAELHRELLETYKAAYPDGWHTIPYDEHVYFYRYWSVHVRAAEEMELAAIIADGLLRQQPLLSLKEVKEALQFVDYSLKDIASDLLKVSRELNVLRTCVYLLDRDKKIELFNLLESYPHPSIIFPCVDVLGKEVKRKILSLNLTDTNSWEKAIGEIRKDEVFKLGNDQDFFQAILNELFTKKTEDIALRLATCRFVLDELIGLRLRATL